MIARSSEGGPGGGFERERRAFQGLLESLQDVPDLLLTEQSAVAFVVEDMKRAVPEAWERTVGVLRDELHSMYVQEGVPGMTWRLAREIHDRYGAFLARCHAEERDPVRRGNLEVLQQGIDRDFPTRRETYEAGHRVPMGSVILEHVPPWFPQAE